MAEICLRFVPCILVGLSTHLAAAQVVEQPAAVSPQESPSRVAFSLTPSAEFQFNDSDFDVFRYRLDARARIDLNRETVLSLRFGYEFSDYDFPDDSEFADAWGSIHTLEFGAIVTRQLDDDWSVYAGPVLGFALENGADWGDAIMGGGVFGATYRVREGLTVGGGLGVVTQIEDDVRIFPIITVNWDITNELRLASTGGIGPGGRAGVELIYDLGRETEIALGGAYDKRRFRLDDDGIAPNGVGEDHGIPIWLRLTHHFNDQLRLSLYGAYVFSGNVSLEDSNGTDIRDKDYDPAPVLGLTATYRF